LSPTLISLPLLTFTALFSTVMAMPFMMGIRVLAFRFLKQHSLAHATVAIEQHAGHALPP